MASQVEGVAVGAKAPTLAVRRTMLPFDSSARGPHETDPSKVARYAAAMRTGAEFPPVRVVCYGEDCLMIVDGHHRVAAAKLADVPILALIADGEEFENLDAWLRAETDNSRADDPEYWNDPS